MELGGVGGSAPGAASFASMTSTPAVELLQAQESADAALFAGVNGEPSDLASLTGTAQAYSLYENPSLLMQLQQWDGSETTGSERAAAVASEAAATASTSPQQTSPFTFNPFDQQSWWTDPKGSTVDVSA
jgi:hypothetical protein